MNMCYSPGKFASMLGVSVRTLQRWDTGRILIANRNPKGRRFYTHQQLLDYTERLKDNNRNSENSLCLKICCSKFTQKNVQLLVRFCQELGMQVTEITDDSELPCSTTPPNQ